MPIYKIMNIIVKYYVLYVQNRKIQYLIRIFYFKKLRRIMHSFTECHLYAIDKTVLLNISYCYNMTLHVYIEDLHFNVSWHVNSTRFTITLRNKKKILRRTYISICTTHSVCTQWTTPRNKECYVVVLISNVRPIDI